MSRRGENFSTCDEVIIIEPIFKTEPFIRIIIKSIKSLLEIHGYEYHSIKNQDYFIFITMKNRLKLVDSVNVLKFLSGIAYILIGTPVKTDFDTLAKKSALIQLKLMLDKEKYFLKVSSLHSLSNKSRNRLYNLYDLEFHLQSELSSSSRGLVRVEAESEADRILYIIIGPKLTYISLLVFKGTHSIPLNYLKDSIICPIFDSISIISFVSILKSGYKPIPILYYLHRDHLKILIRAYEYYAKRNTEGIYEFYLFSIGDLLPNVYQELFSSHQNPTRGGVSYNSLLWSKYQILVYSLLSKLELGHNKIALPIVTFVHPVWYIEKVYSQFENSDKTLVTPLLFNYTFDDFRTSLYELRILDLEMETDEREIAQMTIYERNPKIDSLAPKLIQTLKDLNTRYRKFKLRIGKDDIFDIFDSI
ncbi:MAG: hypothetical protein AB7V56_14975 [Candidatus Nitrosocosmicus sp.]|uniref:hypothetical protein n=1 Tax=Candidatus Nitrosocosmicus agrestis TaxID=2563600 RepID=UPI00122E5C36|nr:hypothetical protein [Candidatus Nitrosocosmicus sp. SS]KAA2278896.1 hypothetical protein F1Z66_14765 [Candidatus Nitrosocosmicus sp. SS]KAF0868113.1 hypothetical protein E5N71_11705 [Candidatus Nitrosocosmicus sp. SS]MDR4490866.1 hypothetical protein [Candidatus Nitrosocosmicus sp.]